jgi:hypothetical protein
LSYDPFDSDTPRYEFVRLGRTRVGWYGNPPTYSEWQEIQDEPAGPRHASAGEWQHTSPDKQNYSLSDPNNRGGRV